jgi:hypothetical protein
LRSFILKRVPSHTSLDALFAHVINMRFFFSTLAVLACSLELVTAFPAIAVEAAKRAEAQSNEKRCPFADMHQNEKRVLGVAPGFNADAQRIDVSGVHAFVPPDFAAGDLRGPCPGLNALANHNYLPHNGWASLTQFVEATNKGPYIYLPDTIRTDIRGKCTAWV